MKKKHYLIYQITNNINGKIYIGKHETFKIDDNYFGSGIKIQAAIKKYGLENFTKTILFELQYDWKNKHHTAETKQKMSNTAKLRLYNHPELNSRFNTVWITNDLCQISISVKKSIAQQIINDNNNWRYGRCINFQKLKQQNNFAIMKKVNDKIHLERQNSLYCAFYTFYYQKYLQLGYNQFQAKYQFNVERTALLHLFRKYAPNYQKFKRFHNKVHASSSNL